jgi:hypothetical protein
VTSRPDVRRFRRELASGLIPRELLARRAADVSANVMDEYGLDEETTARLILPDHPAEAPPIVITFEQTVGRSATTAKLHVEFEPWVSDDTIVQSVRMVKRFVQGHATEHRPISERLCRVVEWVELLRAQDPECSFRSIAQAWNAKCRAGDLPVEWRYENPDMLGRDYRRGLKLLLRPRYYDAHPDDTAGRRRTRFGPASWPPEPGAESRD